MSTQAVETVQNVVPFIRVTEEQNEVITTKRNGLLERAVALVINSSEMKQIGWDLINGIAELRKDIAGDFADSKGKAYEAWKAICAQEKGHLDKLVEPDQIVRQKLSAYETECRRIQEEIDRQAREAARKQQEEAQRQAEENARVAREQARKEAEEKRLEEALAAEAAGKPEVAQAILDAPVTVVPVPPVIVPMIPVVVPQTSGINAKVEGQGSMIETWCYEVTDEKAIPREYLLVNESAISKVVKALKGATSIPGIRPYSRLEPRTSGRKTR